MADRDLVERIRAMRKNTDLNFVVETMLEEGEEEEAIRAAFAVVNPASAARQRAQVNERPAKRDCSADQCKAPFRFVALNDRVEYATPAEGGPRHKPIPDGYCGAIEVTWVAETPLLIGAAEGRNGDVVGPMRLAGEWTVPGSSLRGMLRNAMESVAFARLSRINGHHRYGLRDFEHPEYKGDGFPVSKVDEVGAGWLRKRAGGPSDPDHSGYEIVPCAWAQAMIADLPFLGPAAPWDWVGWKLGDKYASAGMARGKVIDFGITKRFSPGGEHNGKQVLTIDANGPISGALVFSDRVPPGKEPPSEAAWRASGKKVEYVFHSEQAEVVELTAKAWATFRRLNCKPARNKLVADGSWKVLERIVEQGGRVPVFHVGTPNADDFAFGLTRLFKVPHKHSVADIAERIACHRTRPVATDGSADKIDLVENLFGYVLEGDGFTHAGPGAKPAALARKGKLAFSFATFVTPVVPQAEATPTVMMGPRASFAPFYLAGGIKDYSAGDVTLAGRKRYLPRYRPGTTANDAWADIRARLGGQMNSDNRENDRIRTSLRFLVAADGGEMEFRSTIRLHNVTESEIGAVLWVLTHGGDPAAHRHMLGRAKAFGAGQIRVERLALALRPNAPGAKTVTIDDPGPFLAAFETRMGGTAWRRSATIRDFLAACRPGEAADLEYMTGPGPFAKLKKAVKPLTGDTPPCPAYAHPRLLPACPESAAPRTTRPPPPQGRRR
ncbi:RAMP superfamily CRISPR-associated protein [Magnetospirillum sp. UT-4]|uniref:RAMP superfamily CRISPR-associated protein n=1 Tax=Magnetospirillum sp. UT-4 TaxID=2681467 RepID=UPI00137FDBBD|nr:RAMP superfamily CRISPR-associated protein [Magnetospirillum sp. UT-4]CAA7625055.1 conserved hypothetical protein [Magnetospirillum sp. UT-4]